MHSYSRECSLFSRLVLLLCFSSLNVVCVCLQACSGKFSPIQQFMYFDSLECYPEDGDITEASCQAVIVLSLSFGGHQFQSWSLDLNLVFSAKSFNAFYRLDHAMMDKLPFWGVNSKRNYFLRSISWYVSRSYHFAKRWVDGLATNWLLG